MTRSIRGWRVALAVAGFAALGPVLVLLGRDREPPCVPADPLVVSLDGVTYRLPPALDPSVSPEMPRASPRPGGTGHKPPYCRPPEGVPTVRAISLSKNGLVGRGTPPGRGPVTNLDLLVIRATASGHPVRGDPPDISREPGEFTRVDHTGYYELISTGPMLFGSRVEAQCGRAPTKELDESCSIYGRTPAGSMIRMDFMISVLPVKSWAALFEEVERLVSSLADPRRGDRLGGRAMAALRPQPSGLAARDGLFTTRSPPSLSVEDKAVAFARIR